MTSSEIREEARKALTGKWGKAALLTLVYLVICFIIGFVLGFIPVIGRIASYAISIPLGYGMVAVFIKLKRGQEVDYTEFLTIGFNNFGKVWAIFGNTILKLIIPMVLAFVFILMTFFAGAGTMVGISARSSTATFGFAGISFIGVIGYIVSLVWLALKGYYYVLNFYIQFDNPDKSAKEIVEESERLMKGNRWKYFWLGITFIGWVLLASLSLGIGYLWLLPYMSVAQIVFYEKLVGSKQVFEAEVVSSNEDDPIKTDESDNK